jgi:hypothetical protein
MSEKLASSASGPWRVSSFARRWPSGGPFMPANLSSKTLSAADVGTDCATGAAAFEYNTLPASPTRRGGTTAGDVAASDAAIEIALFDTTAVSLRSMTALCDVAGSWTGSNREARRGAIVSVRCKPLAASRVRKSLMPAPWPGRSGGGPDSAAGSRFPSIRRSRPVRVSRAAAVAPKRRFRPRKKW